MTTYQKNRHQHIKTTQFPDAIDDMLYNSGGGVMWSLFRNPSGKVTIYYHDTDTCQHLGERSRYMELSEIADTHDAVAI